MLAGGWKSSASANGTRSRWASAAPTVDLPDPDTPMATISGADIGSPRVVSALPVPQRGPHQAGRHTRTGAVLTEPHTQRARFITAVTKTSAPVLGRAPSQSPN